MTAIPYMPLYVADYLADAAHLTTEEHGAYLLLIMTYWQRGKPLPADPSRLANIARMTNERWTDVQRTLSEFFVIDNGVWSHNRIEAELSKFRGKSDKAKAAGKASGESRKSKTPTDVEQKPNVRSTDVQRTLNHTDTDTDTDRRNTSVQSESVAEREATDGRTPAFSDLKKVFNGSTETMLDFIEGSMPGGGRQFAEQWLATTVSAHGSTPVAQAFAVLLEKRASGEISARPLPHWSKIAASIKSGQRPTVQAVAPKRTLSDVLRERAAGVPQ